MITIQMYDNFSNYQLLLHEDGAIHVHNRHDGVTEYLGKFSYNQYGISFSFGGDRYKRVRKWLSRRVRKFKEDRKGIGFMSNVDSRAGIQEFYAYVRANLREVKLKELEK